MHRGASFLLVLLVLLAAVAVSSGLDRLRGALAQVDAFQVREIRLQGGRFLTYEEALQAIALGPEASVWDKLAPMEELLRSHPLVEGARVRRRLPDGLVLEVRERAPVALVPTPSLVPVDASGRVLPVDPAAHGLDLPLIIPAATTLVARSRVLPARLRDAARELGRLARAEPQFSARISEMRWARGALAARLVEPSVTVVFTPPLDSKRLREGLLALGDARERWSDREPESLDLRFADQVVVGYKPSTATD